MTYEIAAFTLELRILFKKLTGSAKFETLEEQLSLELRGDGKGHIDVSGEVEDNLGMGNRLRFAIKIDQSQLAQSLRELETVILKFPVRIQ